MWPVTQDIRDAIETREMHYWLNGLTRTNPPLNVMKAMKAAFDAAMKEPQC
jgi:hypothetical protein